MSSLTLGLIFGAIAAFRGNVAAPPEETFGALSRSQEGAGIATTATSITSGDDSGHWTISGGRLYPSATGVTDGMNAGPYDLAFNDASTLIVNIEADTWDVATTAEWLVIATQSAATLAGKKIALRNSAAIAHGINGSAAQIRRNDYRDLGSPLVIEGRFGAVGDWDAYCEFSGKATLRGVRGVTFRHLRTSRDALGKFDLIAESTREIDDITWDDCDISGQIADPNGDYSTSSNYPNRGHDMIKTAAAAANQTGNLTIRHCRIRWGDNLVNVKVDKPGASLTIIGGEYAYFYKDAIKPSVAGGAVSCPVSITGGWVIHNPVGLPTDSDAVHPDAIQLQSNASVTVDWTNILIEDGVIIEGSSRGTTQGLFADDMKTNAADSGHFFTGAIFRNILIAINAVQACSILQAKDCLVDNVTVVSWNEASLSVQTPSILIGPPSSTGTSGGGNVISDSIADAIGTSAGALTLTNNIVTGRNGETIDYATLFDGPTFGPNTAEEAKTFFNPKAAAGGAGAVIP